MLKKKIGNYQDSYFSKGFGRFMIAECVIESNSWDDLQNKLSQWNITEFSDIYFQEFKFFNIVIILEHKISSFLEIKYKNNEIKKNEFRKILVEWTKRYRKMEMSDADNILKKEILDNENNYCSPHILLYVAGISTGQFISIIRDFVLNFENKKEIIDKLSKFNDYRNILIHNLLSSHENVNKKIKEGIKIGLELISFFDDFWDANKEIF